MKVALHVRERGAGETVLLLHSAGNTGAQWDALGPWLENEFRLLAPDLHDCGATAAWNQDPLQPCRAMACAARSDVTGHHGEDAPSAQGV